MLFLAASVVTLLPFAVTGSPLARISRSVPGCQDASFRNFSWVVSDFEFHSDITFTTPAHQNDYGYANFNLTNSATKTTLACNAFSTQLTDFFYGSQWYNCTPPAQDGSGTGPATFRYNRPTGQLDVNQTWVCDDKEPQWPARFSGAGTTNLTLDCETTTWQNSNWTIGQIYSTRTTTCQPANATVKPYEMTAVA